MVSLSPHPGSAAEVKVPVMKPRLPTERQVSVYLRRMDSVGRYSNFGPLVAELEHQFAVYLGVSPNQVVAVANATMGIQSVLARSPIENWRLPAYTFAATAHAALQAQCSIEFVDVDEASWSIPGSLLDDDPSRGLLTVMPFGAPVNLEVWTRHDHVCIDAAASLGSSAGMLVDLPENWSVVFSLHATKVLPAGEGGLIVVGDRNFADELRSWQNFGFDQNRRSAFVGSNAKMSEIHAAYGLASLEQRDEEFDEWNRALSSARELARAFEVTSIVDGMPGIRPYWIAQLENFEHKQRVEQCLRAAGVETRSWWPSPLPEMPAFEQFQQSEFSISRTLAETTLALPMFRSMTPRDFDLISDGLAAARS